MSAGDNATPGQHRASPGRGVNGHTEGVSVADLIAKLSAEAPVESVEDQDDTVQVSEVQASEAQVCEARVSEAQVSEAEVPAAEAAEVEIPEAETPAAEAVEVPAPRVEDETAQIPAQAAYADELPDLTAIARTRRPVAYADPDVDTDALTSSAVVDTASKSHSVKSPGAKRKRRKVLLAGRSTAILFAVAVLVLTGGAWQWESAKNKLMNTVSALDPDSRDIVDPNAQFGDENYLIVGVDSRIGANNEMGAGTVDDAEGARSDTVMLVNIPANRKRVVAVSFPRDLAITPMKCQAWDAETGKYGPVYDKKTGELSDNQRYTGTKLNSAYALGGPKCLVMVIQKMSGLSINRFMAIDFAGFSKMVDALGGVEVCSTTPLDDYELGTVLANAGRQKVDGHTALNYVRARQVTTEVNGDYGRIKRQQLFVSSLLRSLISSETLFSLRKLNNVVDMFIADTYVDNVKTKDLVDLGQSLQGISAGRITFVTVPTTGVTDADGNEEPRTSDIRALFDAIINDDPLPGENDQNETISTVKTDPNGASTLASASATATVTADSSDAAAASMTNPVTRTEHVSEVTTNPASVTVQVRNPTGVPGLADAATSTLQGLNFNTHSPDNNLDPVTATTVRFSAGNEQAAATVAATFKNARLERVSGLGDLVEVVLGPDYTSVGTPLPSGSTVTVDIVHTGSTTPTALPEDLTVTNAADITCE